MLTAIKYTDTFSELCDNVNMFLDTYPELKDCVKWYEAGLRRSRNVYRIRNVKHALACKAIVPEQLEVIQAMSYIQQKLVQLLKPDRGVVG